MKRELTYLGIGLLLSLNALRKSDNFISWETQLLVGIILMTYGSYVMYLNFKGKKSIAFILSAWGILLIIGALIFFPIKNRNTINASDLKPATNFEGIQTCEEGREKARNDIENGKVRQIFGSLGSRQPLAKNLKIKYNIEIIEVEGVVGIPNECYNQIMYEEIQRRYGKDAFNKAYE